MPPPRVYQSGGSNHLTPKKIIIMKKIIYLLFCLASFSMAAQDFAPAGAKWYFPETYFTSGDIGLITFTGVGDTIIDNKSCRIVYKDHGTCYSNGGNHYFYQSNDSVFYYNQDLEIFSLHYVFDAEVGDSWTISGASDGLYGDTIFCTVDSISYFEITPSDSLKIQHVTLQSEDSEFLYSTRLIEKIGFERGLLTIPIFSICDGDFDGDIRCYEDDEIGLISFSNVACDYTPTVNHFYKKIEIYPNPSNDLFFIKPNDHPISSIQLIDFQGVTVFQKEKTINKNESFEVNTAHLASGIYFLKINHNNIFTIKKIIVNH